MLQAMDVAGILRAVDRSYEQLVVGMISIGIAGVASRELLGWGGRYATPWLK